MRKGLCIFVMLLAWPAFAQITAGTIVIFNFTKDQLVVAADSRGVNTDTGVSHDTECKISTFGHRLIFASVGNARHRRVAGTDPVSGWDNAETTRIAFRSVQRSSLEEVPAGSVATAWANAMVANWQAFYRSHPDQAVRLVSKNGGLTVGAFAEAHKGNIHFQTAKIKFDRTDSALEDPIASEFGEQLHDCWECGPGNRICALGKHYDVAAKFCSQRKSGAKIKVGTPLKRANDAVKLAVKIAELTVDAYQKTPGDVGGLVDAITLKRNGNIIWNALKSECPAGQD